MVKLEKNIAQKKPAGGKLQKPLKAKDSKVKVAAKLIKEVKPDLVKKVEPQNGKVGKKNKPSNEESSVVQKKNKKAGKIQPQSVESPPTTVAPKKDKKKGVTQVEEAVPDNKPAKKAKKAKQEVVPALDAPAAKKAKKIKAEPVLEEVVAVKKGKKAEKIVEPVPVKEEQPVKSELPAKKGKKANKTVEPAPVIEEVVIKSELPSKKGKKAIKVEVAEPAPVIEEPTVKSELPPKKGKKAEKVTEIKVEAPVKSEAPLPKKGKQPKAVQNGKPAAKPKGKKDVQQNGKAKKAGKQAKNPVVSVEDESKKVFEAPPFDEENFNKILTHENIGEIVTGLNKVVKKEIESKKQIFSDYRYLLDVTSHKIGNCPKRMVKLTLKHPIPSPTDDDIVLFVPDLQRGRKVDYDATIEHYDDLLRRHNIAGVKVIPFNQLKNEYNSFELKRKLANSYEHFLCDGRIVSHVVGVLGVITQKPRSSLHAVRLNDHNDVGAAIRKGIRRTAFKQLSKGNMTTIPIASHRHTPEEVADNVLATIRQLKVLYPGGLGNIRSLNIKVGVLGTSSLPLYMSMVQGPDANPYAVGPREQKMLKLKRETKDVLSKFQFTNEGTIKRLTQEQITKKRKIQEGKAGEAVSEEVSAKKAKKEKKKKNKKGEESKVEEVEEEKIEELVRLEENSEDSEGDDEAVELVKEGEEFEDDDDDEDDE